MTKNTDLCGCVVAAIWVYRIDCQRTDVNIAVWCAKSAWEPSRSRICIDATVCTCIECRRTKGIDHQRVHICIRQVIAIDRDPTSSSVAALEHSSIGTGSSCIKDGWTRRVHS